MRFPLTPLMLAAACLAAARPAPAQAPAPALAPDTSWVARSAIYQVFVRDFSPAGNFRGVADGLHRIQSAGANVLWLMPIHPIGELERKGSLGSPYAAKDYRAINPAFGNAADLRALVRAVHARGMKLILDFVPNHTAADHPWVRERPDFYVRDERGEPSVPRDAEGKLTDWTDVVQLDYANPRVRREMIATMRFWLEEFGIDGFRMDVAGFLPYDFWREAVPELRAAVPRPILLLAEWGDLEMHRIGFDLTYGWDSYKRVKDVWRGEPASRFVRGELADMRAMPPGGMRLRFTTNHDETAWDAPPITLFGSPAAARAAFVAVALLPGRPLLYNGQEVESPQKLPLFERDPVEWNQRDAGRARAFYGTVLKLARTEPGLVGEEFREVRTSAPDDVIAYRRGDLVVLVNARARGARVAVTDGEVDGARDLLSNRAQRGDTVSLPGYGAVVLKERKRRGAAQRAVHLDRDGVIRWSDDRREVALFGANYVLPTASDYRAAGYLHADRKRMIDEDMAHFARMGWDGLRLTFWGDWEASDSAGNLIANDHLDLQDYLIARARERGIYMLFSPIQLYGSNWPDALHDTTAPGFGRHFGKERMGTDPAALAAQVNYLRQILEHVNPYTGVALKDEPAILFIELVNEPWHHPEDLEGSVRYIDALTEAVRATGCRKPVFYNVSQDFRIAEAIRRSRAQGVTVGWYPTGLNSGRELEGNYLRGVDAFPEMLRRDLARLPRIVYEFDAPDLREATMYPAMARTFRAGGAQFAVMFAYDMLRTASRNLGWQTHYLNMVYTPRKAVSAIIAAEAMRRLPRMRSYGPYPRNTRFGEFRVSPEGDLAELVARDAFLYAGSARSAPPDPSTLRRIAGYGSSPVVAYGGEGIYFLDKVRPGLWRLEVYPDAVPVRDPFEPPSPDKIVTRAIRRAWPMTVSIPDLGETFTVQPIAQG
ncbi:MAG: hypothetical protein H0X69_17325, partial [Gemmatimonadales bacterium]|nr:hypothetical protein [Gemmatimonadales bacterium]